MALTVDWGQKIISVPKADTLLIQAAPPIEIRELNINDFRLELKSLEDDLEGIPYLDTHIHNPPVTVAGVTLARVVEIINGYTVTFENGTYAVNIVGGNSNIADVVNINNVGVRTANSAGLQDAESLQIASFQGAIAVDPQGSLTGTTFPRGTREFPVNNMADALAIAESRGINTFLLLNDLTLNSGDYSLGYDFVGATVTTTLTVTAGANTLNCRFEDMVMQGTLTGNNRIVDCNVINVSEFYGLINSSAMSGTLTLKAGEQTTLTECYSNIPGSSTPTVDMNVTGSLLAVRGYNGGLTLTNATTPGDVSMDFNSGQVIIESSVTGGTYIVRGIAKVTDNSGVGATLQNETVYLQNANLSVDLTTLLKISKNRMETNPSTGILTIYDDDDSTPLLTANIYEDVAEAQAYRGQGAERRNRLT